MLTRVENEAYQQQLAELMPVADCSNCIHATVSGRLFKCGRAKKGYEESESAKTMLGMGCYKWSERCL